MKHKNDLICRIIMKLFRYILLFMMIFTLQACDFSPRYAVPFVNIGTHFKETPDGWKIAQPQDQLPKGSWWSLFQNETLNNLLKNIEFDNQSILALKEQYKQANELVIQARTAFFPVIMNNVSALRRRNSTSASASSASSSTLSTGSTKYSKNYLFELDASWEPDLWGSVRNNVDANLANKDAVKDQLENGILSVKASLVQVYYQLATIDEIQKILENVIASYKKLSVIARNRYASGTAARQDILEAENLLKPIEIEYEDNKIGRAQYEHAIAILLGKMPVHFALASQIGTLQKPVIPVLMPSSLLERRPDIAQAERLVFQSNAQIGTAISALFPVVNLIANEGSSSRSYKKWFSIPTLFWLLEANAVATLFDAGLKISKIRQARSVLEQLIATYRQTVLTSFQEVEDNLTSLKYLEKEILKQTELVQNTRQLFDITMNQYKNGTKQLSDIMNAQIVLANAEIDLIILKGDEMVNATLLIKSLGGGWIHSTGCH
jgi:NodT family efflux transporter outer membrane factor (OMF) lipoprotein